MHSEETPPALVLGGPWVTALAVIRDLGRSGIRSYAVGTGRSFVSYSRWHRALPGPQDTAVTPSSLDSLLREVPFERMVLIPCSDEWALAVAGLDPALAARFPASVAPRKSVEALVDKARFAEVLDDLGVPHPWTARLGPGNDLMRLPDGAFQDAFLKPRNSQAFSRRYGVKAFRFGARGEAVALANGAREAGLELMLQEYIPGLATCHYMVEGFVDRTGSVRARFVRQRLRMYPPDFGDSTYMVSTPLDAVEGAVAPLDRLLTALDYRGVFEAEFKYDERDDQFKLLEVNSRPWAFIGFAATCGVGFCKMIYRDALALPVESVHGYEVGRHCIVPFPDTFGCWQLVREGRLTPWAWGFSWMRARQLVFSWDDPAPAAASFVDLLHYILRRWGTPGTTCLSSSSSLPTSSGPTRENPVTLLPGRAKLVTSLSATGSPTPMKTIGRVLVACLAARAPAVPPPATMTSTLSAASSAESAGSRSTFPSASRYSITRLRPST